MGAVALLLLATLLVGREHGAMVTGLFSALSSVLAWYFGSQGLVAAEERASRAESGRLAIRGTAETAEDEAERLRRDLRMARLALAEAMMVPAAREKIYAVMEGVEG